MTTNDEIYKEIKSYETKVMDFNRYGENNFCPAHYEPKEDGLYQTIRCGLSGIYTVLNEWKDGKWQAEATDGSTTIAYSREKVVLKNKKEKEMDNPLMTLDGLIERLTELREIAGGNCPVVLGKSFNPTKELMKLTMVSLDSKPQDGIKYVAMLAENINNKGIFEL